MPSTHSSVKLITVASVPAEHVYVQHLSCTGDGIRRLPDPRPVVSNVAPGQWWPPAVLEPGWIDEHCDEFDLVHVHFGFDAIDPSQLARFVDTLEAAGKPLVYTVHDLRNPHHATGDAHREHLDVLVPRATALITLTEGAASAIRRTWGRDAEVIPHPHVVDFERMRQSRSELGRGETASTYVVGLHAKSVRASMDPAAVLGALLPMVNELKGLRLIVDIHHDVADRDGARHDPKLMETLHRATDNGLIQLAIHDCYTDSELWDYLQSLDLSVLPYRFGTHSGWLEACHDLGTAVLAPTCGYFAEQQRCLSYRMDDDGLDAESLQTAVRTGYAQRPRWRADPTERAAERARVAAAHRHIYEAVLR